MATTYPVSAGTIADQPIKGLTSLLARFRVWRSKWREIDQITVELNSYSDSALAELGLKRSDIPDVARGRYRQA